MAPVALWTESLADVRWSVPLAGALLWLTAVVSISGYLLWFALLARASARAASAWFFLTPPLGLLMGWPVRGEPLVAGIVLVTRRAPPRRAR